MDESARNDIRQRSKQALESICLEAVADAAAHYRPLHEDDEIPDDEFEGSNHDPEYVWDQAIERALGPEIPKGLNGPDFARLIIEHGAEPGQDGWKMARTHLAECEVSELYADEGARQTWDAGWSEDGKIKPPAYGTSAQAAIMAVNLGLKDEDEEIDEDEKIDMRSILWTYLANVRGGVMDATMIFDREIDEGAGETP